jgi:hypothetical protein
MYHIYIYIYIYITDIYIHRCIPPMLQNQLYVAPCLFNTDVTTEGLRVLFSKL